MKVKYIYTGLTLLCISSSIFADEVCPVDETKLTIQSKILSLNSISSMSTEDKAKEHATLLEQFESCLKNEAVKAATKKFEGLNWGTGLAFMSISSPSIDDAKIIDGVVRITEEHSRSAAILLETHYFIHPERWDPDIAWGPFASIRLADTEGADIGAYGLGIMMGFKDSSTDGGSWNVGLGYYVDTEVNRLGSGVSEGSALPGTETKIRYKEIDKSGWMIMLSSTF